MAGLLEGKVVLMTGAARGIGRASALHLADEGADVGAIDLLAEVENTAEEIKKRGKRSCAAVCDISDRDQVREAVGKIRKELGDIDVLVNNAGIVTNIARMVKMEHEAWERELSVNLTGGFNMIKEVIGPMVERKWGRIINLSSIAATGGLQRQVGYAASKAGVLGMTKTVALEHGRDGITCNAILPGLIGTELVSMMPEEIREGALDIIPCGRLGKMEDVACLIAFLASDLSAYINGVEIPIDGGMGLNIGTLGSRGQAREMREKKGKAESYQRGEKTDD